MDIPATTVARAESTLTGARAVTVHAGGHILFVDESAALGGGGTGTTPYETLLASLGACTAITLRMYAERKQWNLGTIRVELDLLRDGESERIERLIRIGASLAPEDAARLVEIANKTPVTKSLLRAFTIPTRIRVGNGG